jgi:PhnB protein
MLIQPYLHFDGRCEEAVTFYTQAVGAKTEMLMRYKESPEPPPPGMSFAGKENWVMHASFRVGDSVVMASDDCTGKHSGFAGFQLSLTVADAAEAEQRFTALAQGGQVKMPLTKTFYSPSFGMLTDRFGVSWMVIALSPATK